MTIIIVNHFDCRVVFILFGGWHDVCYVCSILSDIWTTMTTGSHWMEKMCGTGGAGGTGG